MAEGEEMERSAGPTEHESMREVMLEVLGTFPQLKALMMTPEGGTSTGNSTGGGEISERTAGSSGKNHIALGSR